MITPWDRDRLMRAIRAGTPPAILDVRSAWEFRRGHVPGAAHVPFWAVPFASDLMAANDRELVIYCGHGPRAWVAKIALELRGFRRVALLRGHMAQWRRAGLPTPSSSE